MLASSSGTADPTDSVVWTLERSSTLDLGSGVSGSSCEASRAAFASLRACRSSRSAAVRMSSIRRRDRELSASGKEERGGMPTSVLVARAFQRVGPAMKWGRIAAH